MDAHGIFASLAFLEVVRVVAGLDEDAIVLEGDDLVADPIEKIDPSSLKAELKATLLLHLGERRMLAGCGASGSALVVPEYIASILSTSWMMLA